MFNFITLSDKQIKTQIDFWKETADNDWITTKSLWKSKRYDACLFYCHLTIEKYLKGLVVKSIKDHPPFMHDLVVLATKAKIDLSEKHIKQLAAFTTFNQRGRYVQDKTAFYKLCTQKFAEPYFKQAEEIIVWLKKFYQ